MKRLVIILVLAASAGVCCVPATRESSAWDRAAIIGLAAESADSGVAEVPHPQSPVADTVDAFVPEVLATAAACGIPFAGVAAWLWRKVKSARAFGDLVAGVQKARRQLKDYGPGEADPLALVDNALRSCSRATKDQVDIIKQRQKIASVTGE